MIFYSLDKEQLVGKIVDGLRSICGADVIISKKSLPPKTEAMVKKHIDDGAILYRVISFETMKDLSREELLFNLHKMHELGARQWQSILITEDKNRIADYDSYISLVDMWIEHGGSSLSTYGHDIGYYLQKREKSFIDTAGKKTILVPAFAPRRDIEVVKDWTITLASFPGIGLKGARYIRSQINALGLGDDLLTALWFVTDLKGISESDGTWKEVRINARKWLGLPDGFDLDINVKLQEVE